MIITESIYGLKEMKWIRRIGNTRFGSSFIREALFIRLLAMSEAGKAFIDAHEFAEVIGLDINSPLVKDVWGFCLNNGILTETDGGFSAISWLEAKGMIPAQKNAQIDAQTARTPNLSPEPENAGKTQNFANKTHSENRVDVRPNVQLSHEEIALLRAKYTDKQITDMVDYYSEWKRQKGNNVRVSDYQNLVRWVHRILTNKKHDTQIDETASSTEQMNEILSWGK